MTAMPQADGDDGEKTPDVEGLLEQGQDARRGNQDDTVAGLSTTASDRGLDTEGSSGHEPMKSLEQDTAIRLLQRQVNELRQYLVRNLPSGITRR